MLSTNVWINAQSLEDMQVRYILQKKHCIYIYTFEEKNWIFGEDKLDFRIFWKISDFWMKIQFVEKLKIFGKI